MSIPVFWIIWTIILPLAAILLFILIPLVYFLVFPSLARKLIRWRFQNVIICGLANDAGSFMLVPSKDYLPEGCVETAHDEWRLLPRAVYKKGRGLVRYQDVILRKFNLKGLGKPIWMGYAGKVPLMNPTTLAGLQQKPIDEKALEPYFQNLRAYAEKLPKDHKEAMLKAIDELYLRAKMKPITLVDPSTLKELIPRMYTISQVKSIAQNRYLKGLKAAGSQIMKYGLIMLALIVVLIIGILAISSAMRPSTTTVYPAANKTVAKAVLSYAIQLLR
jgi:hypothetical protein